MKKRLIDRLLGKPVSLGEVFLDKTKFKGELGTPLPPDQWPAPWSTTYFKDYPRLDKVVLPNPDPTLLADQRLVDTLFRRVSTRGFGAALTLEEVSTFLYYSLGMKESESPYVANRFYASPGSRYALEVYVLSLHSELPEGLYHYNVRDHVLEILEVDTPVAINRSFNQDWIAEAGCVVLLTGVFLRNTVKYGERGFRHVLVESGHAGQNLYLVATAMDLRCCSIGGWSDTFLEELLDIDGVRETVIYAFAFGHEKASH